jgi:nucleotide-binding universal stress UspA family protein
VDAVETIVVGVDGSAESRAALAWALAEARLRGARVLAVHAWTAPEAYAFDAPTATMPAMADALRQVGERVLESAVSETVAAAGVDVPVERRVVDAGPAEALLAAAGDAALVVVGSRGRGGFASLLLGSVSHQVAQHAPCPVVIVRGEERAETT